MIWQFLFRLIDKNRNILYSGVVQSLQFVPVHVVPRPQVVQQQVPDLGNNHQGENTAPRKNSFDQPDVVRESENPAR